MNLTQYFELHEAIGPLNKLQLPKDKIQKLITKLEELGYIHDSEVYMTKHEAKALERTGKVFATTNNGMLLWVTDDQLAELKKVGLLEGSMLGAGMSKAGRAADVDQSDREYILQRQQRQHAKSLVKGAQVKVDLSKYSQLALKKSSGVGVIVGKEGEALVVKLADVSGKQGELLIYPNEFNNLTIVK